MKCRYCYRVITRHGDRYLPTECTVASLWKCPRSKDGACSPTPGALAWAPPYCTATVTYGALTVLCGRPTEPDTELCDRHQETTDDN